MGADGELLVDYAVQAAAPGSSVEAAVSVWAVPGWIGTVSERLTCLLLAGGALHHAIARMARKAERRDVQHRPCRSSRQPTTRRRMVRTTPAR